MMVDLDDIQLDDMPDEFREVARIIGIKAALDLVQGFAGCQLYVPKLATIARQQIYRQMYDEFRRHGNFKQVAVKYNLSESHTRQVIKEEHRRRFPVRERQGELF